MKFHRGERLIQERLGLGNAAAYLAERAIRTHMPAPHRDMLSQLPFLIAAGTDPQKRIWATLFTGTPGFIQTFSDVDLNISSQLSPGDALKQGFATGSQVGLLGIDLATRRRGRINGIVTDKTDRDISVEVKQCYGNCPQHISPRQWHEVENRGNAKQVFRAQALTEHTTDWVHSADTFFIGSGYSEHGQEASGLDVSHRGGKAGFVQVLNDQQIQFPDYPGNNFFNTLGNIVLNPQVGLLFVDFIEGSLLQLSGRAQIDWNPTEAQKRELAERIIKVDIEEVVVSLHTLPIRWNNL